MIEEHNRNHIDTLALFAIRYALVKNTSADIAVCVALKSLWNDISISVRHRILETIESEKGLYGYDDAIYGRFLKEMSNGD